MVSLWPWKGGSSTPASFEKTLSTLSTKIAATQSKLDRVRASSRRVKVLWTLYLSFAYLIYAIVLLLVAGYKNLGAWEWTGMAGGPLMIYLIRVTITAYFNFRIDTLTARLKDQQGERSKTIQKLKDATKYDSTLELIEKYGGAEGSMGKKKSDAEGVDGDLSQENNKGSQRSRGHEQMPGRTQMAPPPTANILPRDAAKGNHGDYQASITKPHLHDSLEPGAEFAPNAFSQPGSAHSHEQYNVGQASQESHWYDRVFDVLLGEDETAPKNRIILICQTCRLVNGQAPPGTKSLSELGVWRCMSCNASNGEIDEGARIVREVLAVERGRTPPDESDVVGEGAEKNADVRAGDP